MKCAGRREEGAVVNRRELLVGGATAGAALMSGCFSRRTPWEFFTDGEARTLAALCDQIIPADDYPSASQAGAVTFIDRQLVRHYKPQQKAYREGLRTADDLSRMRFEKDLAAASAAQQLEIAVSVEKKAPEFFELVRRHTLQGYYGSPRHGGNRDAASWRMLGLAEPPLRGRAQYDLTRSSLTAGPKL
jgi:gluconate 2-dehydrogenase gamma chain